MYQQPEANNFCNHISISQSRLNMMVRHLKLSQRKAEMLASFLKIVNILAPGVLVTSFRKRQEPLLQYFEVNSDNTLTHCCDIPQLVANVSKIKYRPEEWRLFIDSSKSSLKAVLLYFDNSKHGVPVALSTNTKESYEQLKLILELLKYKENLWKICADLKVTTTLSGLQSGYTKNMCFLCLWDTRYKDNQYKKHDWMSRQTFVLNQANIVNEPLVPHDKILLPPLHIKLGIVKNFIKALSPDSAALKKLQEVFPKLSVLKVKEGR